MISIKIKGSNEDAFSVTIEPTATILELKAKISAHFESTSPTPPDQQRLIFTGKVLKDQDTLENYKLNDGNT